MMSSRFSACWSAILVLTLCAFFARADLCSSGAAFTDPRSPVVDEKGRVTLVDRGSCEVVQLDPNGSVVRRFAGKGDAPGLLENPYLARFCHWGSIMILDYNGISMFSADGKFLERWKPQGLQSWSDRICDIDRFGRLYMPMRHKGTVECAEGMGKPQVVLSQEILAASGIRDPAWVHVDREGNLYVQDAVWSSPVVIYDSSGRKKMVLRPPRDKPTAFGSICDLALSPGGHFLICSDSAKEVLEYDAIGNFLRGIAIPKDYRFPAGLTTDALGRLYLGLRMVPGPSGLRTGDILVMAPDGSVLADLTGSAAAVPPDER